MAKSHSQRVPALTDHRHRAVKALATVLDEADALANASELASLSRRKAVAMQVNRLMICASGDLL